MCITYDAVACQVWFDPLEMAPGGGQPMCLDHAGRLNPPKGWVVLDRRSSQAELVTSSAGAAPAAAAASSAAPAPQAPRRRFRRGWGQFDELPLEFASPAARMAPPAPVVESPPVAAPVAPEPIAPEPIAPEPVVAQPVVAEPVVVEPVVVEPVAPEPVAPEPIVAAEVVAEPEAPAPNRATRRRSAKQERSASQDTAAMLKPKGRLLSRAFESSGPQRSVLTDGLGIDPETGEPIGEQPPTREGAAD